MVLEPPLSGTEWGWPRGGGGAGPAGAGAAGCTTEAAGGAHQKPGTDRLEGWGPQTPGVCGLGVELVGREGRRAGRAGAEPWRGRASPGRGGCTYSGLWEGFLERVWRGGGFGEGDCTKCGRGSALWVVPLRSWSGVGGASLEVEPRRIRGGELGCL